jgi:hypothetical protein
MLVTLRVMDEERINGSWTPAEAVRRHPDLTNAELVWRAYPPPAEEWDHDHCAFCRTTITTPGVAARPDVVTSAYTDDAARVGAPTGVAESGILLVGEPAGARKWVCPTCADAYRNVFDWHTHGGPTDR